eukprot:1154257-Pelagomonas_calceolata.AAC.1
MMHKGRTALVVKCCEDIAPGAQETISYCLGEAKTLLLGKGARLASAMLPPQAGAVLPEGGASHSAAAVGKSRWPRQLRSTHVQAQTHRLLPGPAGHQKRKRDNLDTQQLVLTFAFAGGCPFASQLAWKQPEPCTMGPVVGGRSAQSRRQLGWCLTFSSSAFMIKKITNCTHPVARSRGNQDQQFSRLHLKSNVTNKSAVLHLHIHYKSMHCSRNTETCQASLTLLCHD